MSGEGAVEVGAAAGTAGEGGVDSAVAARAGDSAVGGDAEARAPREPAAVTSTTTKVQALQGSSPRVEVAVRVRAAARKARVVLRAPVARKARAIPPAPFRRRRRSMPVRVGSAAHTRRVFTTTARHKRGLSARRLGKTVHPRRR